MYGARPRANGETGGAGNVSCFALSEHTSFGRNGYATCTGMPYAMLSMTLALGLGCVKARRRSITMEEVIRPRPF
jgi:hypothetical protein